MKTNFFNQSIMLELPSIKETRFYDLALLREKSSKKPGGMPPAVFVGGLIHALEHNLSFSEACVLEDKWVYEEVDKWRKKNPKDAVLAHLAWDLNNLEDYDLNVQGFLNNIVATLSTSSAETTASIYSLKLAVVKHVERWSNEHNTLNQGIGNFL